LVPSGTASVPGAEAEAMLLVRTENLPAALKERVNNFSAWESCVLSLGVLWWFQEIKLEAAGKERKTLVGRYVQNNAKATRPKAVGVKEELKPNIWLGERFAYIESVVV